MAHDDWSKYSSSLYRRLTGSLANVVKGGTSTAMIRQRKSAGGVQRQAYGYPQRQSAGVVATTDERTSLLCIRAPLAVTPFEGPAEAEQHRVDKRSSRC